MNSRLVLLFACMGVLLSSSGLVSGASLSSSSVCGSIKRSAHFHSPDIEVDVHCGADHKVESLSVNCSYTKPESPSYDFSWTLMLFHSKKKDLNVIADITDVNDKRRVAVNLVGMQQFDLLNNLSAQVNHISNRNGTSYIAYKWTTNVTDVLGHYMCLAVIRNYASLKVSAQAAYSTEVTAEMLPVKAAPKAPEAKSPPAKAPAAPAKPGSPPAKAPAAPAKPGAPANVGYGRVKRFGNHHGK